MIVTINTDASFNQRHQIGTYAFYVVSDAGRAQRSGKIKKRCVCSAHAEIRCIMNALHYVISTPSIMKRVTTIIINTDCLNAVHVLKKDKAAIKRYKLGKIKANVKLYEKFYLTKLNGVKVDFRHVKAHSGVQDARSFSNEYCDMFAKKEMGEYIKQKETIVVRSRTFIPVRSSPFKKQ